MESLDPKVQRKHDAVCLWRRQWERCQGQRVKLAEKRSPWPPENSRKKSKTFDAEGFAEGCLKMPKGYWQTLLPLRTHTHAHTHTFLNLTNNKQPWTMQCMPIYDDWCRCMQMSNEDVCSVVKRLWSSHVFAIGSWTNRSTSCPSSACCRAAQEIPNVPA